MEFLGAFIGYCVISFFAIKIAEKFGYKVTIEKLEDDAPSGGSGSGGGGSRPGDPGTHPH